MKTILVQLVSRKVGNVALVLKRSCQVSSGQWLWKTLGPGMQRLRRITKDSEWSSSHALAKGMKTCPRHESLLCVQPDGSLTSLIVNLMRL